MEVESDELDMAHLLGSLDDAFHVFHGNAELVLGQSRGDIGMGVGTDIGVDAQCHLGCLVHAGGNLLDDLQFGLALHVEAEDTFLQSQLNLPVAFAHAGIDDT